MYPEALALRDSGFQSTEIAEHILKTYIKFQFADTLDDQDAAHTIFMRRPNSPANRFDIIISLTPELVWPLLLPNYSKSEKFVTCTAAASVLLHELAVRAAPSLPLSLPWNQYADHDVACCANGRFYHDRIRQLEHRSCPGPTKTRR